jgi:hypothetical protein
MVWGVVLFCDNFYTIYMMWVKKRMSVYDEWKEDMGGSGPGLFHVLQKT